MKIEINIKKTFTIVCEYYGLTEEMLISRSRKQNIVDARQMYCYVANEFSRCSSQTIGDVIQRDRTTVLYAITQIRIYKTIYPKLQQEINEITEKLLLPKCAIGSIDLLQIAQYNTKILNCLN